MCCQCKHFYYRINEGSGEKANLNILANAPPRTRPTGFPVAAGVSSSGDWPTQGSYAWDKAYWWGLIYTCGANVSNADQNFCLQLLLVENGVFN